MDLSAFGLPKTLNSRQVGTLLNINYVAVSRAVADNKLTGARAGGRWTFPTADFVKLWLPDYALTGSERDRYLHWMSELLDGNDHLITADEARAVLNVAKKSVVSYCLKRSVRVVSVPGFKKTGFSHKDVFGLAALAVPPQSASLPRRRLITLGHICNAFHIHRQFHRVTGRLPFREAGHDGPMVLFDPEEVFATWMPRTGCPHPPDPEVVAQHQAVFRQALDDPTVVVTPEGMCDLLGCSAKVLDAYIEAGIIPAILTPGGSNRFPLPLCISHARSLVGLHQQAEEVYDRLLLTVPKRLQTVATPLTPVPRKRAVVSQPNDLLPAFLTVTDAVRIFGISDSMVRFWRGGSTLLAEEVDNQIRFPMPDTLEIWLPGHLRGKKRSPFYRRYVALFGDLYYARTRLIPGPVAAKLLAVLHRQCVTTIKRNLVEHPDVRHLVTPGGHYRIPESDLYEVWREAHPQLTDEAARELFDRDLARLMPPPTP